MSSNKTRRKKVYAGKQKAGKRIKPQQSGSTKERGAENFDVKLSEEVDPSKVTVQLPPLSALENFVNHLAAGDDPIKHVDVEQFIEILDPENWVRLFSPSTVRSFRDSNGRLIYGDNYDAQMETVFNLYLNPVAREFGRFVTGEIPCEVMIKSKWAKMYEVLTSWSKYQHFFLYACDPFASAKTMRCEPSDPTTLN